MRLTKKSDNLYYTNAKFSSGNVCLDNNGSYTNACIEKLGQLEDIEEELGIDLITLFKALKNGIYIYDYGMPFKTTTIKFNHLGYPSLYCKISDIEVLLKDYGKTWALTKEELS